MKVKIRKLLNPLILDAGWVGFQGDSEYVNKDGELVFGYWEFHDVDEYGHINGVPYKLDDMIEDYLLYNNDSLFIIENDKGVVCKVRFKYIRSDDIMVVCDRCEHLLDYPISVLDEEKKELYGVYDYHFENGYKCTYNGAEGLRKTDLLKKGCNKK